MQHVWLIPSLLSNFLFCPRFPSCPLCNAAFMKSHSPLVSSQQCRNICLWKLWLLLCPQLGTSNRLVRQSRDESTFLILKGEHWCSRAYAEFGFQLTLQTHMTGKNFWCASLSREQKLHFHRLLAKLMLRHTECNRGLKKPTKAHQHGLLPWIHTFM